MRVDTDIFREYDIRGLVDSQLTPALAEALGRAVGTTVRRGAGRRVVVGADCRTSGEALSRALRRGLVATGCEAIDVGVVPTPVGYWSIHHHQADGGVQITGSHNPPEYNGFKLTLLGRSLHGPDIQNLRQLIEAEDYEAGQGSERAGPTLEAYIAQLAASMRPPKRRLKVIVDAGNGTGGIAAVPLYRAMGHAVTPMYCEMDGTFPNHHPDPTVEANVAELRREVVAQKADLGLAFDGDADRLGVIDERGQIVWGDKVLIVLARAVLAEAPGATILGEVKCSKTLYEDIAKHGGKPLMWRTGHSLIKSKMKEVGAALAGEMSGHIFYQHRYLGFDDGVYAGARLLELMAHDPRPLSAHLADVPATVATPEIRFDCPEAIKFKVVQAVVAAFAAGAAAGGYRVVDIDGARVEWPDGWGLVRASNTQPILVMRFEASSQARVDELRQDFEALIQRQLRALGA